MLGNSKKLVSVDFGDYQKYTTGEDRRIIGDTWSTAWSSDNILYSVTDDTDGFNGAYYESRNRNVILGAIDGLPPNINGRNVNGMDAFGRANQLGSDGGHWKGNGIISVDGILFMSVSRHWYHRPDYDYRQIARDGNIIMSRDQGKTWNDNPQNAEPLPMVLFPGQKFAVPFFLDFGQDGNYPLQSKFESDHYVYALSTDGYWDNGNHIHLARVERNKLVHLKLEHWEFYCGLRQGSQTPIWRNGRSGLDSCYPIISSPYSFGQTGMNYIEEFDRYMLIGWHYPKLEKDVFNVEESVWDFYEAPNPWGPWTKFYTKTWEKEGFYNPGIPSKFVDGGKMWALTCGNFADWHKHWNETLYTLFMVPFEVKAE